MSSIIYFGSAFNPPHRGHMNCLKFLENKGALVLAGPSAAHAFGKKMLPFSTRVQLLRNLMEDYQIHATICEIEETLATMKDGPVYTWDVLNALKQEYPQASISFAMGQDNQENFHKFYRYADIQEHFGIVVIPAISDMARSTQIREAVRTQNIDFVIQETSPGVASQLMQLTFEV